MARFIIGVICTLGLLAVAGSAYVYSGAFDVAASRPHGAFARWLLGTAMKRSVVARAAGVPEPPHFTAEMVMAGFRHYDEMCTDCHGGPGIEQSEIGRGLNPRPPDLARAVKDWTPRQLFWIIKHGVKMTGMPSFGVTHSDAQVWSIVAFIERLPKISAEQFRLMRQTMHQPENR